MTDGLPSWCVPGARFRYLRRLYHVRGIVDGGAVVRTWLRSKASWRYEWFDEFVFEAHGLPVDARPIGRAIKSSRG